MATETGPAPNSIEELRGLLKEQFNIGEMLKTLLSGSISLSKASTINSLWAAFEDNNAGIVQHSHLSGDDEYVTSGYFDALKKKYESRMQDLAKLGATITPKPKARSDGLRDPAPGTSTTDQPTLRQKDIKYPTEQEERLKELIIRIIIAKKEMSTFLERAEQLIAASVPSSSAVLKAKLIGLNRHWEDVAILHQKILRCSSQTGYDAEDTYLLEERFDTCHAHLEEMMDDKAKDISTHPKGDAQALVKEIHIQMKILNKILSHLKGICFQPQSQSFYELKLEEITALWTIIKRINVQIWQSSESDDECFGYTIDTFTEQGFRVEESISWLKENLKKCKPSTSSDNYVAEANLPTIQIPKFDGNWKVWKDFKDLFKEVIGVRTIGFGSKLRYLKSYLSGEPLNLIKHLPSTCDGYATAWNILQDRYDNDRAIVNHLFSTMMSTPSVKSRGVHDIKRIHDTFKECYLAYNNIKGDTNELNSTEDFIHFLIWSKLDEDTQLQYEQQLEDRTSLQALSTLFNFMESRFIVLSSAVSQSPKKVKTVLTSETKENNNLCTICKSAKHAIFSCSKFSQMTIDDRESAVKLNKLCYKCLKPGHRFLKCKATCSECKGRHHALLHNESKRITRTEPVNSCDPPKAVVSNIALSANVRMDTLLPTAIISVYNNEGDLVPCRALLDTGATSNFITTSTLRRLGLHSTICETEVTGVGGQETSSSECVDVRIKSNANKYCTCFNALVLDEITSYQAHNTCDLENLKIPKNVMLADYNFNEHRSVDILLGTKITFSVIKSGQIKLGKDLFLQNTRLGWVVAGDTQLTVDSSRGFCHVGTAPSFKAINTQLEKFWAVEHHDSPTKTKTTEEIECENHFINSFSRSESGRYIVRIPFKTIASTSALGESRSIALRRFYLLERKLCKVGNEELRTQYVKCIQEYLDLGHMTEIHEIPNQHCFIPHHGVVKTDGSVISCRVVFDASAVTSNGTSLNELQMVGPTIQNELFDILLGFRFHKYVLTTDIRKMYRQVEVHPEDQRFQLIFWRDNPKTPLKMYQLNRVTFGTASAPFLATRCLNQLAMNEGDKCPRAAKALMEETYVDDILTGESSKKELHLIKQNLINLLSEGGFELGKFASNCPEILADIPEDRRQKFLNINDSEVIKTLGMVWNPERDEFNFSYQVDDEDDTTFTKREVLSGVARLFDPLGLVGPIVLLGKLFMKQLWKDNLQWDDKIKNPDEWLSFKQQLSYVKAIKIPRWSTVNHPTSIELHAFSDASQYAYGCCLYVRSSNASGDIKSMLLCSKSKLAPTSVESIARLELCAALLMVELVHRITRKLKCLKRNIHYYTDSQIVLTWINKPSYTLETFVANRVAKIQRMTEISKWKWIKGNNNPADIISKGMTARDLQQSKLWFHGPDFLSIPQQNWPHLEYTLLDEVPNQKKVALTTSVVSTQILPEVSSYQKAKRIIGNVIHFINAIRIRMGTLKSHLPRHEELLEAEICLIRDVQKVSFPAEFSSLQNNRQIPQKSSIRSLTPFFDKTLSVIRVGGRLENAGIPEEAKFQYLLPEKHHFTTILARDHHERNAHSSCKALQYDLRQRFWIINSGKVANKTVKNCVKCARSNPETINQLMAALPRERVIASPAFETTGVDFCGPVWITQRIRGRSPIKSYIAVFVCFTTKAIHLELAEDLSAEKFLEVLKRFVSRRGLCRQIYSDNATNFTGTNRKLEDINRLISTEANPSLKKFNEENNIEWIYREKINWKFIPPRSPHMGGLWEAAVKSTKNILEKMLLNTNLTYPELSTVLCQIEAQLNSRPLSPLSADPNDLEPLTPGHFLIFRPLNSLPETNVANLKISPRDRFGHMQQIQQHFWNRWTKECLSLYQKRYKWKEAHENVKVGTMVLLHDINLPPLKWPIGRIVEVFKSPDNLVRRVKVKTPQSTYVRTLPYISPLPVEITDSGKENAENDSTNNHEDEEVTCIKRSDEIPPSVPLKKRCNSNQTTETHLIHIPPKKRCVPAKVTSKSVIYSVLIFMALLPLIIAEVKVSPLNEESGIFIENIGKMGLSKSTWTIVTYFNLTSYWSSFSNIKECVQSLNKLCDEKYINDCYNITNQLHMRLDQITSKNEIILNLNGERLHKRNAPLGFIGSLLHLTSGVMDEEHANQLIDEVHTITQKQHYLNQALKNLTSYQDTSSNVMIKNQDTVLFEFKQIKETINCANKIAQSIDAMVHFNAATNNIHLKIIDFEKTQDFIIDAITDTRHSIGNSFLITPIQLESHVSKIRNFLPVDLKLPSTFISEIYKTMEAKARVTLDFIVFEIHVPLISTDQFNLLRVHPLPSFYEGKAISITPEFSFMLLNDEKDKYYPISQTDMINCKPITEKLICHQTHPIFKVDGRSGCEIGIIKGNHNLSSQCSIRISVAEPTFIQLRTGNSWATAVPTKEQFDVRCSQKELKVTLEGHSLLKMDPGCILYSSTATLVSSQKYEDTIRYVSTEFSITPWVKNLTDITKLKVDTILQNLPQPNIDLERNMNVSNIHHYALGYTNFLIVILMSISIVFLWKRRFSIARGVVNSLNIESAIPPDDLQLPEGELPHASSINIPPLRFQP